MLIIRRFAVLFLSVGLLAGLFSLSAGANTPALSPPRVSAHAMCLMEAERGDVLLSKNQHLPMGMASTTKLMTALCALSLASPDALITVDVRAVGVEGSSVYLTAGEVLTLRELLYALLLESANDAATAIAIGCAGSEEAFVSEMNRLALEWGLESTHFVNPHGLYHPDHYTTAYALCRVMQQVLADETLLEIIAAKSATIPGIDGGVRQLGNHNRLLSMYEGCIGGKTGYTMRTGRCLVSAAQRAGVTLIAVTLMDGNDWRDHMALFDYGFSQYEHRTLCQKNEYTFTIPVVGGCEGAVTVTNPHALELTLPKDLSSVEVRIEAPRFLYAEAAAGQTVGHAVFYVKDAKGGAEELGRLPLITQHRVEKSPKRSFWKWLLGLLGSL